MKMLLRNLCGLAAEDRPTDLRVASGRIREIGPSLAPGRREKVVDLDGWRALPGLINAHDHLGLNLLPHLGAPPYTSFYEWAQEIYRPQEPPIREVLSVRLRDRLLWGAYKNLISGVTTVAHHDPYTWRFRHGFPLHVIRRYGWAHSLGFGGDLQRAFARARGAPFLIHAAEGVDRRASNEVAELDARGLLTAKTVLIHAIAVDERQHRRLAEVGASIVWCPASNLWLYGHTAPISELVGTLRLALGTDSTLSGSTTLFDELHAAAATGLAEPRQLVAMVTTEPARIFGLTDGQGRLTRGSIADLIVLPDRGSAAASLLAARPADLALVVASGRPRLAMPQVAEALRLGDARARIDGERRWLWGDLAALRRRIASRVDGVWLARLPLWSRLTSDDP